MELGTIQYNVDADTTGVDRANKSIDQMADNAQKAGATVDAMGTKVGSAGAKAAAGANQAGTAFRGLRGQAQNLGWQLQDVAVQAQMGTSAFVIFSQQGSQLVSTMGKNGPLVGALIAVSGIVAGVLFNSLMTTSDALEEMADNVKSLVKEMDTLSAVQRKIVNDAIGFSIEEQIEKRDNLTKAIKGQIASIETLNRLNGQTIQLATGERSYIDIQIDNTQKISDATKGLTANKLKLLTVERDIAELQDTTGATKRIRELSQEAELVGLVGEELYRAEAAQKKYNEGQTVEYVALNLFIDAQKERIKNEKELEKEAEKRLELEAKLNADLNKQIDDRLKKQKQLEDKEAARAKAISKSIAELEKQNALYGNQSKYEEVLYDIENGLVKVTKKEKERYLAAAKASDQAKIIGDEWNETLRLMEDLDNPFDNDWVGKVKKGGDTISNMWERIDETASDAWVGMFDGFDGLMDGIQNVFKRTLAEMAHEALTKPILLNIQQGGIGNIGAGIGSGAGLAAAGVIVGAALISEWNDSMDKKLEELTAEYKQASQSTGTLLAAGNEKSNSINNAISELGDISGDALNVNRAMLGALNDIRDGIGKASAIFGRTGISGPDVGGLGVTTSDTRLGSMLGIGTSIGDVGSLVAGVGKVFGGTVGGFIDGVINSVSKAIYSESKSVIDSGIQFTGQTLAEVLAQGAVDALSYATVQTKEKFLGITTKNNASVQTGELDIDLTRQLGLVFGSASDALEQAALSFGLDFNDYIDRLVIDPMKLSLKDLSGDELTAEIDAFLSSTLDVWAKEIVTTGDAVNASVSILDKFQKVGEGAFETVTRLSSQLNTFNSYVDALSLNFNATGFSAVAASQAVADYAGGFDRLGASLSGYYENFFSESERSAQQMQLLTGELNKIGVDAVPATREAFRELISGLDLTVESEQKQFAALINLQGVFAELVPLTEAMAGASKSLSEIAGERYSLETQLLQLNGDTVALRDRERELLHESNRTLYDNIKGMEDSIAAAKERYASEQKIAEAAKAASDEIFNLNQQYFDLTATEAEKRNALMQSLLSDEARAIQNNINHWIDARAAAEAAAQAASSAFSSLQQSIGAERERINSIVSNADKAKSALESAVDSEIKKQDEAHKNRIDSLKSLADQDRENNKNALDSAFETEKAIAKARSDSLKDSISAIEESIGGLTGLFESLNSTILDMGVSTKELSLIRRKQAQEEIASALFLARAGGSLPTQGELDQSLSVLRDTSSDLFGSRAEMMRDVAITQNKLSALADITGARVSEQERQLHALEAMLSASELSAQIIQKQTDTFVSKYDQMIVNEQASFDAEKSTYTKLLEDAQAQYDLLTGIDTKTLSVEEALLKFNESLLAADFTNAQEQLAQLDKIENAAQLQVDALNGIDGNIYALNETFAKFNDAMIAASKENQSVQLQTLNALVAEMKTMREDTNGRLESISKHTASTASSTNSLYKDGVQLIPETV